MDFTWWFTDEFTEKAQVLYDLLFTKNFNAEALRAQLDTGMFSVEDINLFVLDFVPMML